jgi:hypothetical protein
VGLWLNLKTKVTELKQGGLHPINPNSVRRPNPGTSIATGLAAGAPVRGLHCNFASLSPDKTLSAVAEVIGHGRIRITVQAFAPEARNSTSAIVVRSKTNPATVWLCKQITLNLNDGWVGDWSGPIGNAGSDFRPADAALAIMAIKRA